MKQADLLDAALQAVLDVLAEGKPNARAHAAAILQVVAARRRRGEPASGREDPVSAFAESAAFTGEITDSIGRKRCYQDGKQVPCHEGDEAGQDAGKGKEGTRSLRTHGLASLPAVARLEQMASDMVTGKGPPPSGPVGKALSKALAWIGHALHKVEHAALLIPKLAAHAIADDIDNTVAVLPGPAQTAVRAGWLALKIGGAHAGKAGMALAFANWTLMQKAAERIAQEKGASPEEAKQIRGALSAVDMKTFEVLKVSALSGVHAAHAPLSVAFVAPPATTTYLAYNFAAHPLASWRAAKGLVKSVADLIPKQELGSRFGENDVQQDDEALRRARLVADALEAHGYDDWYFALLMAALEETGEAGQAIEVANESYRRQPKDPSAQADEFGEWDPQKHPHGQHGHWAARGETAAADLAAGRPSKAEERHTSESGEAVKPAPLPFRAPPPKKGKKGEGMKARPKGDESQTAIGDKGEALALALGFRSILPPGQRSHLPGEVEEKGSTIDLEYDHSGRGYELKLCNTTATEYRLKAKKSEKDAKMKYASLNDLTPHVLVGVRDVDTGEVHFYAGREPGLIGAEVSEKAYDYVGTVKLEDL